MIIIGCKPHGRNVEQHDVFFGISESLAGLIPAMKHFWPEAKGRIHLDAWREVTAVNGHRVTVVTRDDTMPPEQGAQLFFVNLGGYQRGLFDELHYKLLAVQPDKAHAVKHAKTTSFYKEATFKGATSHIDDHYGVDVDDVYNVKDILPHEQKLLYALQIGPQQGIAEDELHIGYYKLSALDKW